MTENNAKNTNAELPAFPHKDLEYDGGDQYKVIRNGLTKREYIAAMAKAPAIIIDKVMDLWKGDNNKLPGFGTRDFDQMLKDVAEMEARYQSLKADALLNQLNKNNGQ